MLKIINHPLIKDKLTRLRKQKTLSSTFRINLQELTQLMVYEATKDFELKDIEIETPMTKTIGKKLKYPIALIPILRAGLGMVDGVKSLIPNAAIGHLGIYRDEKTLKPIKYFCKMPLDIENSNVLLLDPMLATGGTAINAIEIITKEYKPRKIIFICIVACPEGVKVLESRFPDIEIFAASLDERLNDKGYIIPGLGDAGDRIFGTK